MRFNDFDKQMRRYEQSLDQVIRPEDFIVVRLDGKGFTKFTKSAGFEKPFDEDFKKIMVQTTMDLIKYSGFHIIYGYTQSDEISLLFDVRDDAFGRKVRKINSTLAGIASASFMKNYLAHDPKFDGIMSFDCRVVPIPGNILPDINTDRLCDYFIWRQDDANRNALNGWCYWTLRKEGKSKGEATSILSGKGNSFKNELLFQRGINYNDLPKWQKRGVGIYRDKIRRMGLNPLTGETKVVDRTFYFADEFLPCGDEYRGVISGIVLKSVDKV